MIGDGAALAAEEAFAEIYAELSLRMPTPTLVVACHGFGCSNQAHIILSPGDRARLATLLAAGKASPAAERRAIAGAVQWFDRRIGPVAGTTTGWRAPAPPKATMPGRWTASTSAPTTPACSCVLTQFELLHHHRPELPVSRGFLIDGRLPHTTAVLSEIKSGQRWAVDNWTRKYGEMPEVMPLDEWRLAR